MRLLKDPRYEAIDKVGTKPHYDFNDARRFRGLPAIAALFAIAGSVDAASNPDFEQNFREYVVARERGDQPQMDLSAGLLGDNVRSLGFPDPFATRL